MFTFVTYATYPPLVHGRIKFNFKIQSKMSSPITIVSLWIGISSLQLITLTFLSALTSFNSPSTCFMAPILANLPTMFAKELSCPSSLWVMTSINALSTSPKISTVKQRTCKKQCKNLESETRSENIALNGNFTEDKFHSIFHADRFRLLCSCRLTKRSTAVSH